MIVGYLDNRAKNIDSIVQRQAIEEYACGAELDIDIFFDEFLKLTENLQTPGHTLILANIVSLGDSLQAIKENLQILLDKGLTVISVKEGFIFEPNHESELLLKGIELSVDIRSSMLSIITCKALNDKKAKGYKLGRDFGLKNKRYIWEGKEDEIKSRLLSGMSRKKTAEEVGMSVVSVYAFLKLHPEIKTMLKGQ